MNMNPGQLYSFTHLDMLSSMQLIQLGEKFVVMLVLVPEIQHVTNFPKLVMKRWRIFLGEPKDDQNAFKPMSRHVLGQMERCTIKWVLSSP